MSDAVNSIIARAASDPAAARVAASQLFGEHALAGASATHAAAQAHAGSTANRQIQIRDSRQASASVSSGSAFAAPRYDSWNTSANAGLYASYNHPTGFFVDANAGLGVAWNDTATTDALSGGSRTGSYRNTSFQLGTTVGYSFALPAEARIIPSLGLQWTNVRQQGWTESVQSPTQLANWFGRSTDNYLSLPLQVRMNKTFHLGGDASITPELRAAWVFEAIDPQTKVRMGYVGSNASTTLAGLSSGRSRGIIGAGVKAKFTRNVDAFVDYNLEFRNKYQNHNVMAGLGVSF